MRLSSSSQQQPPGPSHPALHCPLSQQPPGPSQPLVAHGPPLVQQPPFEQHPSGQVRLGGATVGSMLCTVVAGSAASVIAPVFGSIVCAMVLLRFEV
jgi:hypothetical protein